MLLCRQLLGLEVIIPSTETSISKQGVELCDIVYKKFRGRHMCSVF